MESTVVIAHATIVTGDAGRTVLHDGALAVSGGVIAAVGRTEDVVRDHPNIPPLDGRGKAVFPGLINCHSHATSLFNRGIADDFGFPASYRFPEAAAAMASGEERGVIASLSALEAIRSGSTTVVEIGSNVAGYAGALAQTGLRWVLAESASDGVVQQGYRPGEPVWKYSEELRQTEIERAGRMFEAWHGKEEGRISCMASAQLVETSSPELLAAVRELAERYGARYTIHLNQSLLEVESLMRMRGVRPTQSLFANDFLGPELLAAHCRFLDSTEIALMGSSGTNVSHQPAMAARRGMIPPIPAMREAGCTIGMGTDNNTQDMVEVMRTGMFTERILRGDGEKPQPEDILEMTTMGGARALGMAESIGSLEVGKKADLFVVDARRVNLLPTNRIVSSFVSNGQPSDIESVMVDGRWLMWEGKVLTMDEGALVAEADEVGRRAWRRLVEKYPNVPFAIRLPPE